MHKFSLAKFRQQPSRSPNFEQATRAPLVDNPDKPWKKAAFSQDPRGPKEHVELMRTDRDRLTLWKKHAGGALPR